MAMEALELAFMLFAGLASAVATRVGTHLGAARPRDALVAARAVPLLHPLPFLLGSALLLLPASNRAITMYFPAFQSASSYPSRLASGLPGAGYLVATEEAASAGES